MESHDRPYREILRSSPASARRGRLRQLRPYRTDRHRCRREPGAPQCAGPGIHPGARSGCDRLYRGRRCRSAVRPMKLRDRQVAFSDRCHTALEAHGNTLGVAPTGAGKTVMGSHIVGRRKPKAALVLQHRDELVTQNRTTFELVNPGLTTGLYPAERKEFGYNVTCAMNPTLENGRAACRENVCK